MVRVIIIIAVVLLLIGVIGFVVLQTGILDAGPTGPVAQQPTTQAEDSTPEPTSIPAVDIVVAVQQLPRGFRIPANAIELRPWPETMVPVNAINSPELVVGSIARTDIVREQPILFNMLAEDLAGLASVGSDAAAILPPDLVAISMPIDRLTSVAYAIQDGDRVDIIVSMLFVDVDEAFQSITPNQYVVFRELEDGNLAYSESIVGRPDQITLGNVIVQPLERQRPRLVTQRTIENAFVVHTGTFPPDGRFLGIPHTPTPIATAVPDEDADAQPEAIEDPDAPTVVPTSPFPDIITLGVTPQEAVLLTWAIEARMPLTLTLRSAQAGAVATQTTPVTLDFFMNQYRIERPGTRDYTIEPAITSIRQLTLPELDNQVTGSGSGDNTVQGN